MADLNIDEVQAKDEIKICDVELKMLKSAGMETSEIENILKIARSFFILGLFDKSFQFASRANRMIAETREGKSET